MNIKVFFLSLLTLTGSTEALINGPTTRGDILRAYCQNLENRLKGLPQKDRDAIIRYFQQELRSYSNAELFNQHAIDFAQATIITNYAKIKAEQIARTLSRDPKEITSFSEAWHNRAIQKIANNESLEGCFDNQLQAYALEYFKKTKPQMSSYQPTQPTPSAPPIQDSQRHYPNTRAIYYVQESDKKRLSEGVMQLNDITGHLYSKGMPNRSITRFGQFFLKSIQTNPTTAVIPPTQHTQNAFVELFDYELHYLKNKLSQEISPSMIEKSIQTTRQSLIPVIAQLNPSSADRFQQILSSLEDTVIENAGIACPICTETYKIDDVFGSTEKISLQGAHSASPCHSVCKTCAQQGNLNNCPECRRAIDQQDLRKKISQPDSPANWRP